jgi:outer membrane protein assembly factor BamB
MTPTRRAVSVLALGLVGATLVFPLASSRGQQQPPAPPAQLPPAAGGRVQLRFAMPAQPGFPGPGQTGGNRDNEFSDAITLPVDRQARKRLDAADDYIKEEAWGEAARLLQVLLDGKEDVFVQVRRKSVQGAETMQWTSVRAEASRLLGTMPENGLAFYELQFGVEARRLLGEAKQKSDPQLLAEVAQRFFHTEAGAEATNLLGTYHLDRGRALMAALCFERLLHEGAAARGGDPANPSPRRKIVTAPLTLFKAALAFRRAGDSARAEAALKQLAAQLGRSGLRLGDQPVGMAQLQKELDRSVRAEVLQAADWPLFRGDPSRSAPARGSGPYLQEHWERPLEPEGLQAKGFYHDALRNRPEDLLPAFYPIATGGKLVYRTFSGISALDLKTRELAWDSCRFYGSLSNLAEDPNKCARMREWLGPYTQGRIPILFENSTLGTLSTDGSRVYAVDDLAVPPHPSTTAVNMGFQFQPQNFGALQEAASQSRLTAFDLDSGKFLWELGGPKDESKIKGSYFLGPPLPLGGKLYVLVDQNAELRLVCLDPPRDDRSPPTVAWTQMLAAARNKMIGDVGRRTEAVQLAYAEGILVCPTNAGAVFGVDLLSHSLVWAHSYHEGAPVATTPVPKMPGGQPMVAPGMGWPQRHVNLGPKDWKAAAPVLQDGKVVFTAHDAPSLHCLNLRDGRLLWKERRGDDQYLAGVFPGKVVLVGKSGVRALSLADGKPLWRVETGSSGGFLPSGQGVASGRFYYLPLRKTESDGKVKGEVCTIDLEEGLAVGRTPAPPGEAPGNLVLYEGAVLSQTETAVTVYPQLDVKLAEVDAALRDRPSDPRALRERGELRLYQGNLAGAVADLRQALASNPPTEQVPQIRHRLYETLTELLRRDWGTAGKYLDDYRDLCQVPIPEGASKDERERLAAEQRRRLEGYYCLLAKGREQEGKVVEAFQAYLDYSALASGTGLVRVLGEQDVKARPDLWVQGRIAALVAKAGPEQRKPLEEEIGRRWKQIRTKETDDIHRFVAAFGDLFAVGKEARLELAERLVEDGQPLEAEMNLVRLRVQKDDRPLTARAVEALARLMTRKGLLEDAVHYYRVLGRDFAQVVVRDGKTGADLLRELEADPRFLVYLDNSGPAAREGTLRYRDGLPGEPQTHTQVPFEPRGELLPYFQRYRLVLLRAGNSNALQLAVVDRDTGAIQGPPIPIAANSGLFSLLVNQPANVRYYYHLQGHLVVFCLGYTVYAYDLVERTKLWDYSLLGPETPGAVQQVLQDADGNIDLLNAGLGTHERLGQLGPVTASYVCIKTRKGLVALDPVHGTELWTKTDLPRRVQLFGDEQHVFYIEVRDDGTVGAGRALRGQDGASVQVPDFAPVYQHRQRLLGGSVLASEAGPGGAVVLRLYDVISGKDLWKRSFAAGAVVLRVEDPELAGVVEPDGTVTAVDLSTRREVLRTTVEKNFLEKVTEGLLLQDQADFYVILNRPAEGNNAVLMGFQQAGWATLGTLRTAAVNGWVFAFRRDSGQLHWRTLEPVLNQQLLLEQFQDLPMLLFSARTQQPLGPQGFQQRHVVATLSLAKATGKLVYHTESGGNFNPQMQFHTLRIDRRLGRYDLIGVQTKLRHYIDDGTGSAEAAGIDWNQPVPPVRR